MRTRNMLIAATALNLTSAGNGCDLLLEDATTRAARQR
jgi:hypothetical protein